MVGPNDDVSGFSLSDGKVTVRSVETGAVVDAPEVAARGLAAMTECIETAGSEIHSPGLRLIKSDEEEG